jgi:hypothetical protein
VDAKGLGKLSVSFEIVFDKVVKVGEGRKMSRWGRSGGEGRSAYTGLWLHLLMKYVSPVMDTNREEERMGNKKFRNTLQLEHGLRCSLSSTKPRFENLSNQIKAQTHTKFVAYLYFAF